ncbi:unnamed protein product [Adineta steineri]|uniref:Uncharacterized protein n=1 Tax=Adineta steineri TaxID=433720 RepID=A0A814ACA4_9BILA|nr:unnamed protein product [Adineta steineri]CAF0841207.1 unnamed protein product [Adineta steineri]CAF0910660.1 unnamed protein product [Adineta steineri]
MICKSQQQINDRRQSKSYQQQININDDKQRYQTINTTSISPLMSVQSDVNTKYDTMQMSGTHNYYGSVCRAAYGLSSNYYYEHPQQHCNNHYNYSNEYYQQQRSTNNKDSRYGGASIMQNQQQR